MDRKDWDRRYAGKELVWTGEPNRFLVAEAADLTPGRACDLACGEGRNAVWLASRGWRVDAVDFSGVAIEKARRLAGDRGVTVAWEQADLTIFTPSPRGYDLVAVLYLQLPWEQMQLVLDRAAEAVAVGGTLLLVGHDRTNIENGYGGPQDPAVLYVPEEVAGALPGLDIEKAERVFREVETEAGTVRAIDCLVRARRRH